MSRIAAFARRHWLVITLLLVSGFAHGFNMFNYPSYFDDEGTYMSQAWALLKQGSLAPYTYWYDHAPLGWIIIAAWVKLTGGFFTFGSSIDSGRVLMLVVHLVSAWLVYSITWKVTGKKLAAAIAVLIFSLSPLGIVLQRMVFLDNIMMMLLLLSFYLLIGQKKLLMIYLSAVFFGMAVLVKETAPFLAPGYLVLLYSQSGKYRKKFTLVGWLLIVGMMVSLYVLYALLKNEFFPVGQFTFPDNPHVSLIETLKWQASRSGGFFLDPESEFMYSLKNSWLVTDLLIIAVGLVATLANLVAGFKNRLYMGTALASLFYVIYIMRGGIVNDQYMIPVIPLFAINIGLMFGLVTDWLGRLKLSPAMRNVPSHTFILLLVLFYGTSTNLYTVNVTQAQERAVQWIRDNVKDDELVVIDGYALVDLFPEDASSVYVPRGAHHYWKFDQDTKLRDEVLGGRWWEADYVLSSPRLERDVSLSGLPLTRTVIENSTPVQVFPRTGKEGLGGKISIAELDPVTIYKLNPLEEIALRQAWAHYKKNFIHSYGQVIDPDTNRTTSEGQSYAMLQAAWMGDKQTFDGVWSWTKDHMQHRLDDKLLSWLWIEEDGVWKQGDSEPASDADQDIALALLFAYKQWGGDSYLAEAQQIINDIWIKEVAEIQGDYYLKASPGGIDGSNFIVNPSYFSPAHYAIFAEVDPAHPWAELSSDGYDLLDAIAGDGELPSDWIYMNRSNGRVSLPPAAKSYSTNFGFDAFRVMWRVALDKEWFGSERAAQYLSRTKPVFDAVYPDRFSSIYDLQGNPAVEYVNLSTLAGPLSVYSVTDREAAGKIYQDYFAGRFDYNRGAWGSGANYYDQNWAWFGTALYSRQAVNLWAKN